MSPRAVGGWSSSVWGCCWKPQATAAVLWGLVGCAGRGPWPVILGPGMLVMQWGHLQGGC